MSETFSWAGTTVGITGASRGIGAAFARLLAPRVGRLILIARSEQDLEVIAGDLACEVTIVVADLSEREDMERVWRDLQESPVDVWINNAGVGLSGRFQETDEARARRMLALNVEAPIFFMRRWIPKFIAQGRGRILNVGSIAGLQGSPFMAEYGAGKGYLNLLSEAVSRELSGTPVWVGALIPGSTDTPFFSAAGISADELVKLFQTAEKVAATGIRAIERRRTWAISGWPNRLMAFSQRWLPRRVVSWLAGKTLRGLREDSRAGSQPG